MYKFFEQPACKYFFLLIILSGVTKAAGSNGNSYQINKSDEQVLGQAFKATVISVELSAKQSLVVNYTDTIGKHVSFINDIRKDSVITHYFELSKPTVFINPYIGKVNGKYVSFVDTLMVLPGDSVFIDKNLKIKYATHIPIYLNDIIHPLFNTPLQSGRLTLNHLIDTVDKDYYSNINTINQLSTDERAKQALNIFNLSCKYNQLYIYIQANWDVLKPQALLSVDSLNKQVLKDEALLNSINGRGFPIYYPIILSAKRNGAKSTNYWKYFTYASDNIKQTQSYKDYTVSQLEESFLMNFDGKGNPMWLSLRQIADSLAQNTKQDDFKDSIQKLVSIILSTKTDYAKAKAHLQNFYGGRYAYFFANDAQANHERKNIANIENINLEDFSGKKIDFKSVVPDKNYKLTLVHFWASWCIPCIGEIPALRQLEINMKDQPVKFVSISIDNQNNIDQWKTTAKKEKLFNDPHQYRMVDYIHSPLTTLLQISTIPRYLIIDTLGNVVDDNAERPGSGKLRNALLKYLK